MAKYRNNFCTTRISLHRVRGGEQKILPILVDTFNQGVMLLCNPPILFH